MACDAWPCASSGWRNVKPFATRKATVPVGTRAGWLGSVTDAVNVTAPGGAGFLPEDTVVWVASRARDGGAAAET